MSVSGSNSRPGRRGRGAEAVGARSRGANEAVRYLRKLTVGRATTSYFRWVGRAIGWWTILYMIFWLIIFAIAGVQSLAPLSVYVPSPAGVLAVISVAVLVIVMAGGKAPPLTLDRRDLYRLGLGPQRPLDVLSWRYRVKQAGAAVGALLAGVVWSLLAPAVFGFNALYAAPALAALAMALLDLRWLRYVANHVHGEHQARKAADQASWLLGGAALLAAALTAAGHYLPVLTAGGAELARSLQAVSPLAALTTNSPFTLALPLALFVLSRVAVRRTLAGEWPPRFAPQSLVLTQIQALRTFQMMSALAGMGAGASGGLSAGLSDDGERRRLLDSLHDRPGATKPRRSLPLPAANAPQWAALAWRTAVALYRRPLLRLGLSLLFALSASAAVLVASGGGQGLLTGSRIFGGAAALPGPAGTLDAGPASAPAGSSMFGGALAVLFAALILGRAASGLLGPHFDIGVRPLDAVTRSFGRTLPAMVVLVALLVPAALAVAWLGAGSGLLPNLVELVPAVVGSLSTIGIVVLALEKYSSWSGAAANRIEPQLVAAMLAALPALVLGAFGVGEWTVITQFLLLGIVALIAV